VAAPADTAALSLRNTRRDGSVMASLLEMATMPHRTLESSDDHVQFLPAYTTLASGPAMTASSPSLDPSQYRL
jgi:cytosine/uracil/thiamine/allantoin permease